MNRRNLSRSSLLLLAVLVLCSSTIHAAEGRITLISAADPELCQLDLGTAAGLTKGTRVQVIDPVDGKSTLGELIVILAEPNRSAARGGPFRVGMAVRYVPPVEKPAETKDLAGRLADIDGKRFRVLEVVTTQGGKAARAVRVIDPDVEARIRAAQSQKTEQACALCRGENRRCARCGGSGFVKGAAAVAQSLERDSRLMPANAIQELKSDNGKLVLRYDPTAKVLTDPASAAEGVRLFEAEQTRKREEREKAIAAARAAQKAAEEAQRKAAELARQLRGDPVKVVNSTGQKVVFIVTAIGDPQGNLVTLGSTESKPHLIKGLEIAKEVLSGEAGPKPLRWTLEPGETASLLNDGRALITSKLKYDVLTGDLSKSGSAVHDKTGNDFVITLGESDLHAPVLVKVGPWNIEQNVWYTTHEGKTPTTVTRETSWFGKPYWVINEGQTFEYEKKHKGGMATASADVENPTDKKLKVAMTVEFTFAHVLMSHQKVDTQLTMLPGSKSKVFVQVDTKAIFDNREATSVRIVDITTTEE